MLLPNFKRVTKFKIPVIKLDDDFSLALERGKKHPRIIVCKSSVENVCRKESFKKPGQFIRSDEDRIFKGHLQLHKNQAGIAVDVKGKIEGVIKVGELLGCLAI